MFDSYEDVKKNGFNEYRLYLFTKRKSTTKKHILIYFGMTSPLSTRFDGHHKEVSIKWEWNKMYCYPFDKQLNTRIRKGYRI